MERSTRLLLSAFVASLVALMAPLALSASDFSDRGIKLFMENKPQEAVALLELAVREPSADELTHLYLGIAYQQLGRWDDAIAAFRRGLTGSIQYRHLFLFNIANSFFAQGRNSFALESYDQTLAVRMDYSPAYLNRANARMKVADYTGAVADYTVYLTLDPGSSQAPTIRKLVELLGQKAAAADQLKAIEEARKLAEEAARQALLDAVAQSLLETAGSTTSLSAGSGDLQGYDEVLSLDD
ncbi:MAG: tetratricopeptide repeat protein [Spirochaetales bacterium]|nr:MAG: tetratricopeptide repeat protein [Spirochaetales bacterium]